VNPCRDPGSPVAGVFCIQNVNFQTGNWTKNGFMTLTSGSDTQYREYKIFIVPLSGLIFLVIPHVVPPTFFLPKRISLEIPG
jgi:hypothetical protein